MNWLERRSRRGLGREAAERVSAGCYGAIVAASTLAGTSELPAGKLTLLVVATNLVYYGTHVFAYSIGDADLEHQHLHRIAAHHARVGAPMISAAFLPLIVALVLEALGVHHQRQPTSACSPRPGCWSWWRFLAPICTECVAGDWCGSHC